MDRTRYRESNPSIRTDVYIRFVNMRSSEIRQRHATHGYTTAHVDRACTRGAPWVSTSLNTANEANMGLTCDVSRRRDTSLRYRESNGKRDRTERKRDAPSRARPRCECTIASTESSQLSCPRWNYKGSYPPPISSTGLSFSEVLPRSVVAFHLWAQLLHLCRISFIFRGLHGLVSRRKLSAARLDARRSQGLTRAARTTIGRPISFGAA